MIDIHCHVLPGLDDGVQTREQALELVRAAAAEGVTAIVATPHVRADYPTTAETMESALAVLRAEVAADGLDVRMLPGGEIDGAWLVRLTPDELQRFTIDQNGRYLLLESPYTRGALVALEAAAAAVRGRGLVPVLAHPERNPDVQERPQRLATLVDAGALVQVTAASVDGRLGRRAQATARKLLAGGVVHAIATDAHAPHDRAAGLAAAAAAAGAAGEWLTREAPAAIVAGDPLPQRPPRGRRRRFW